MYKHILVPTDGSELSRAAAASAIRLASALGARITGLHVTPVAALSELEAWVHGSPDSAQQRAALFEKNARRYLGEVWDLARNAGVRCQCLQVPGAQIYEEIIKAAEARRCDLIYMAAHGRKGASAVLLGSETIKVLTHSSLPVLVHRATAQAAAGTAKRWLRARR